MTVHFEFDALVEYQEAAIYSQLRFGLGEEFVQAVESALDARDPEFQIGIIGRVPPF